MLFLAEKNVTSFCERKYSANFKMTRKIEISKLILSLKVFLKNHTTCLRLDYPIVLSVGIFAEWRPGREGEEFGSSVTSCRFSSNLEHHTFLYVFIDFIAPSIIYGAITFLIILNFFFWIFIVYDCALQSKYYFYFFFQLQYCKQLKNCPIYI